MLQVEHVLIDRLTEFLTIDLHDAKVDLKSNQLLWDVPVGDIPAMSMITAIGIWIPFLLNVVLCCLKLNSEIAFEFHDN